MRREARCSFCGKHQDQVKRLVAGQSVFICDECVRLCVEIIEDPPTTPRAETRTQTRRRRLVTLNELLRRLLHGVGTA